MFTSISTWAHVNVDSIYLCSRTKINKISWEANFINSFITLKGSGLKFSTLKDIKMHTYNFTIEEDTRTYFTVSSLRFCSFRKRGSSNTSWLLFIFCFTAVKSLSSSSASSPNESKFSFLRQKNTTYEMRRKYTNMKAKFNAQETHFTAFFFRSLFSLSVTGWGDFFTSLGTISSKGFHITCFTPKIKELRLKRSKKWCV